MWGTQSQRGRQRRGKENQERGGGGGPKKKGFHQGMPPLGPYLAVGVKRKVEKKKRNRTGYNITVQGTTVTSPTKLGTMPRNEAFESVANDGRQKKTGGGRKRKSNQSTGGLCPSPALG